MTPDPTSGHLLSPEVEEGIARFIQFRDEHMVPRLPAPPKEWKDLSSDFARLDASLPSPQPKSWRRLRGPLLFAAAAGLAAMTYVLREPVRNQPAPSPVAGQVPRVQTTPSVPRISADAPVVARHPERPSPRIANTELRIFSALHEVGADLGDPVEVEFNAGNWRVVALIPDPERAARLRKALERLSKVQLDLDGPSAADVPHLTGRPAPASAELVFAAQFREYFGSGSALTNVTNSALDHSAEVLSRSHALRKLDQRFPPAVESGLDTEERQLLAEMRSDHRRAANERLSDLDRDFGLLAAALNLGEPSPDPRDTAGFLHAAQRWDRILGVVLGGASTDADPVSLKRELSAAYVSLRQQLEVLR